ncbi:MAG: glycosyl transferase, partial [Actinobacteria bacterium]|nr:glycosyl transferase [Actinomycetota bacterium]
SGLYYKVVDSDDWLDVKAAKKMVATLRGFVSNDSPVDLLVCNYVYEHVEDDTRNIVSYVGVLPENRIFTWDEVGSFRPSQNLLMHSVIYRTQILRDCKVELPKHTFYVDNIFVYVPLPCVETIYYLNVDLYRYYIGREDQSVNEKVMISRIDQQFRVTRIMIDSVKIPEDVPIKRLENYMVSYLTMMMTICSILAILSDREDKLELRDGIWGYLKASDEKLYRRIRHGFLGMGSTLPGPLGRSTAIKVYHLAQRLYKFN